MDIESIGRMVRIERMRKGLTQMDVAVTSGVSKGRVEALENARCNDMGFNTVLKIMSVLGISMVLETRA